MSTGMRKWMEKGCPDIPTTPAEVSIGREELRQLRDELAQYKNERDALRAKVEQMERQEPFDADSPEFRRAFDAALKTGHWPLERKNFGYRSPMSQMAWQVAFCTVNNLKLYALPGAKGEEKMKLSEKIQEALREQQEINLSDPAVQRRLAAQWGYVPAGEQVAPVVKDERAAFREWFEGEQGVAYDGLWSFAKAAWLARAALGAPSVPREAIEKMLTQLMDIAVSNGANSISMPDEYVEVAAWLCGIHAQPAPSVPDWLPVPDKHPTFDPVDLQLADGSVLCGCVPQSDGDYWWEGPSGEVFIDPRYAPVTHWRLAQAQNASSVPEGFSREDLEAVADGLDGYEKTVNVGNVTGVGDDHLESTTAYAARFIRAMLAGAPEAKP